MAEEAIILGLPVPELPQERPIVLDGHSMPHSHDAYAPLSHEHDTYARHEHLAGIESRLAALEARVADAPPAAADVIEAAPENAVEGVVSAPEGDGETGEVEVIEPEVKRHRLEHKRAKKRRAF